jgi:uncharacterized membrane protein
MQERPLLSRLFSYFVRGLLFAAPVGLTILLLYSAFDYVDSIIRIQIPTSDPNQSIFIPGLGFLIIVFGTIFIGFFFSVVFPQTIVNLIENLIRHLPLVRIIYFSFKDLVSAFVGDKRKFNQPVTVLINKEAGIRKVGFMTQSDLKNLDLENYAAVYCPHSYAFSGEMFLVPKENIKLLEMPSAEAMKLIVSGGVSSN